MYLSCAWPPLHVWGKYPSLLTLHNSAQHGRVFLMTGLDCILLYGKKLSHTKSFADWSLEKIHEDFSQFDDC